jgi:L-ascorbate metabolism protein UlaG (beta-lactamase superfamily)
VGKASCTAEDWAVIYYEQVYADWGHPNHWISDRDSKFVSAFWRKVMELSRVEMHFTAAHHQQADGQSERTNQTVELAIRSGIGARYDQSAWDDGRI